jgi:starvation-inducible outer membrane lipoprotein
MNAIRVSFLIATDIFVIAMLVSLLAGCVSTPQQLRNPNGDFISHMASSDVNARSEALRTSLSVAKAS